MWQDLGLGIPNALSGKPPEIQVSGQKSLRAQEAAKTNDGRIDEAAGLAKLWEERPYVLIVG